MVVAQESEGTASRVAVVGAGIVGVCCALYLQRDGCQVTLIDRQEPGQGTSYGNAAIISGTGVMPVATPGILADVPGMLMNPQGPLAIRWQYLPRLAPWLLRFVAASKPARVEEISKALAALLAEARPAFKTLLDAAGAPEMIVQRGLLTTSTTEAGLKSIEKKRKLLERHGIAVERLTIEEARQMEPGLSRDLTGVHHYPNNAHTIQNYRLVTLLAEDFVRNGGRLQRGNVVGYDIGRAGPRAVKLEDGTSVDCDAVVLAAGAWSKEAGRALGATQPLDTEIGYHLTLPDPALELRRPIASAEGAFICTPLEDGLRIGGTVELGKLGMAPNWERLKILRQNAARILPDLNFEGASRWQGFRPSMPDSLPVIGPSPSLPNTYFAFGHGHLGLTFGAVTGRVIADLAAGRAPAVDTTPFRADRF